MKFHQKMTRNIIPKYEISSLNAKDLIRLPMYYIFDKQNTDEVSQKYDAQHLARNIFPKGEISSLNGYRIDSCTYSHTGVLHF